MIGIVLILIVVWRLTKLNAQKQREDAKQAVAEAAEVKHEDAPKHEDMPKQEAPKKEEPKEEAVKAESSEEEE